MFKEPQVNIMNEVPFIKLFKSPFKFYIYDANQDKLLNISKQLYEFINSSYKVELTSAINEEISNLQEKGFMKVSPIKIIEHPMSDCINLYQERNLASITLQVTQQCNLRCKYCVYTVPSDEHQRSHSNSNMSWITAKSSIDYLWSHSVDAPRISIGFYGGEPILQIKLIKKCIEYSKKKFEGKKLSFHVTTNATLLTEKIIQFFIENEVELLISIDGPREIHNKNRIFQNGKGTFDLVIKKIKMIENQYSSYLPHVGVNMVIDTQNNFDIMKSITMDNRELANLKISSSFIVNEYIKNEEEIVSEQFKTAFDYNVFLVYMKMLGRVSNKNITPIISTIEQEMIKMRSLMSNSSGLREQVAPGGPCMPGKRLMVNINGDFFPCERVSETSKVMRIGNIKTGFNQKKSFDILNIGKLTKNQCKNCWAIKYCTACVRICDNGESLDKQKKLKHCKQIKINISERMREIILFTEIEELRGDEKLW